MFISLQLHIDYSTLCRKAKQIEEEKLYIYSKSRSMKHSCVVSHTRAHNIYCRYEGKNLSHDGDLGRNDEQKKSAHHLTMICIHIEMKSWFVQFNHRMTSRTICFIAYLEIYRTSYILHTRMWDVFYTFSAMAHSWKVAQVNTMSLLFTLTSMVVFAWAIVRWATDLYWLLFNWIVEKKEVVHAWIMAFNIIIPKPQWKDRIENRSNHDSHYIGFLFHFVCVCVCMHYNGHRLLVFQPLST